MCVDRGNQKWMVCSANKGPLLQQQSMLGPAELEIQERGPIGAVLVCLHVCCMLMLAGYFVPHDKKDTGSVAELIDISQNKSMD